MAETTNTSENGNCDNRVLAGRLSSYQKMKQKYEKERQELINDIITLVEKGDTVDGLTVKMQWKMRLDAERMVMFGEYKPNDNQFSGLYGFLNAC
jgi:hypothetical protein